MIANIIIIFLALIKGYTLIYNIVISIILNISIYYKFFLIQKSEFHNLVYNLKEDMLVFENESSRYGINI